MASARIVFGFAITVCLLMIAAGLYWIAALSMSLPASAALRSAYETTCPPGDAFCRPQWRGWGPLGLIALGVLLIGSIFKGVRAGSA